MKNAYDVIIRPIITEQSMEDLDIKKYAFQVAKDANKIEIKKAVEQMYGVSVKDVNTVNYHGKRKSRYTKDGLQTGRTNHYKKAFVTLAGDDKIDFYSNI